MRLQLLLLLSATACGEPERTFPPSGSGDSAGEDDTAASADCEWTGWTEVDNGQVDPATCLAWTNPSSRVTWSEAVTALEAEDGGCTDHCDEDDAAWCLAQGDDWAVPTQAQLFTLAQHAPPFDELDMDLWSRDSDDSDDQFALTVDLSQPGQAVSLLKDNEVNVRCVRPAW